MKYERIKPDAFGFGTTEDGLKWDLKTMEYKGELIMDILVKDGTDLAREGFATLMLVADTYARSWRKAYALAHPESSRQQTAAMVEMLRRTANMIEEEAKEISY